MIAIILAFVATFALASLLIQLSIHALPVWAGFTVGLAVVHAGGHPIVAAVIGLMFGGAMLAFAQAWLSANHSRIVSVLIIGIFAAAAFLAGWQAVGALTQVVGLDGAETWAPPFGASVIAAMAISRLRRPTV